jgi:beta-galactosidase
MAVALNRKGLTVDGVDVPLLAGAVHYWRLEPRHWRRALESLKGMGLGLVDLYIPWSVHERGPGELDLGEHEPRHDVAAFLRLAHEVGLMAIVRPGPHINAELTSFGIPERVVWDSRCQARSPRGNPVLLPAPPKMFPVPSYASEAFRDEVSRYFELLGPTLAPLVWPNGPIVLVQIDNEGAMYFRDGAYDQDYHPDAIAAYRAFLRAKYGTTAALGRAYGGHEPAIEGGVVGDGTFTDIAPPSAFDARSLDDLARYLDWAEFHEQLLADTFARFRDSLRGVGLEGIPTIHNFPPAQETTPLNAARVLEAVDMIGLDYYGKASESARRDIACRTSELSIHADARGFPSFACEMGAGFPPIFPPLDERDSLFTAMTALAYGLRGFNLYMAVDRDRWLGAPVDATGRPRAFAESWRRLSGALRSVDFFSLHRRTPVRLVMPRSERRLARTMHAFGPVSGAVLAVMGKGPREGCLEDDLGLGYPVAIEADGFLRSFEEALEARGIPYAFVGGELKRAAIEGARWVVCATSGALHGELVDELSAAAARGVAVTLGPRPPRFDGAWKPADWSSAMQAATVLEAHDPATVDALVARMAEDLGLPRFASDPDRVHVTAHEDDEGQLRVVFAIHAGDEDVVSRFTVGLDAEWFDPLADSAFRSTGGLLEIRMKRHSVRMLIRR